MFNFLTFFWCLIACPHCWGFFFAGYVLELGVSRLHTDVQRTGLLTDLGADILLHEDAGHYGEWGIDALAGLMGLVTGN